jgi:archaellum component FlaC
MGRMETETTQTNEQLASLDHRLTVVERDLAVLSKTVATKDDIAELKTHIARIDVTLAGVQATLQQMDQRFATKADLAQLETRIMKWMIATLLGVGALNISMVVIVVKLLHV